MIIEPGALCTVNGSGDLMMDKMGAGRMIGKDCVIVKVCKSGLILVQLENNPKVVEPVPKRNIQERKHDSNLQ